jgi:hypothetical protein
LASFTPSRLLWIWKIALDLAAQVYHTERQYVLKAGRGPAIVFQHASFYHPSFWFRLKGKLMKSSLCDFPPALILICGDIIVFMDQHRGSARLANRLLL